MLHYRLEHCAQLFTQICHLRFCGNTIYKYTIFVTILPCSQSYLCTIENICSIENICAIENMSQHTNVVQSHRDSDKVRNPPLVMTFTKLKSYIWKRQHWLWLWSSSSLWVDTNIYICAATTARRLRQKLHNNCDSILSSSSAQSNATSAFRNPQSFPKTNSPRNRIMSPQFIFAVLLLLGATTRSTADDNDR